MPDTLGKLQYPLQNSNTTRFYTRNGDGEVVISGDGEMVMGGNGKVVMGGDSEVVVGRQI